MLKTRVLSGAVLVVILALLFASGGIVLGVAFGIVSIIGQFEFYRAVGLSKDKVINGLTLVGYLGTLVLYTVEILEKGDTRYFIMVPVVVCALMLAVFVLNYPKYESKSVMFAFFGFCYAPLMLSFIYLVRMLPEGKFLVWIIFISSWVCDTFAYFTGMLLGKHKLAPVLSPKKSIEGAVGGTVFAAVFAGVYGCFIKGYISTDLMVIPAFVVVCAVGAVMSQIGDLAASGIKRNFEIKDYGKLIPGHGGILDRFDSVIFTAPMIYIVALIFSNI